MLQVAQRLTPFNQRMSEVVKAHIERFPKDEPKGRPERVLKEIYQVGSDSFETILRQFTAREDIYGF